MKPTRLIKYCYFSMNSERKQLYNINIRRKACETKDKGDLIIMNKVVDFIKIKRELRSVLKRKRNNDLSIDVIEESSKIEIYINDYLVQALKANKKEDRQCIEEIVNLLVEQVKIQWLLTENKNKVLHCLETYNDDGEEDKLKKIEYTQNCFGEYGVPF